MVSGLSSFFGSHKFKLKKKIKKKPKKKKVYFHCLIPYGIEILLVEVVMINHVLVRFYKLAIKERNGWGNINKSTSIGGFKNPLVAILATKSIKRC